MNDERNERGRGVTAMAVIMLVAGGFRALSGLLGIFNDQWIVRGMVGYTFMDISGMAWWMLIVSALVLVAGVGILAGRTWARTFGIIATGLAAFSELCFIPLYPLWGLIMFFIYGVIACGLTAWKPVKN